MGANSGSGQELLIKLLKGESNKRGPSIGGIQSLELRRQVQMHLEVHAKSPGTAGPQSAAAAPATEPRRDGPPGLPMSVPDGTPIEVACQGPFHFDPVQQFITLEDRVDVLRINPTGPGDQINCDLLTIFLSRPRSDVAGNPADAANNAAVAASRTAGAKKKIGSTFDLQPRRFEAKGNPVVVRAPESRPQRPGSAVGLRPGHRPARNGRPRRGLAPAERQRDPLPQSPVSTGRSRAVGPDHGPRARLSPRPDERAAGTVRGKRGRLVSPGGHAGRRPTRPGADARQAAADRGSPLDGTTAGAALPAGTTDFADRRGRSEVQRHGRAGRGGDLVLAVRASQRHPRRPGQAASGPDDGPAASAVGVAADVGPVRGAGGLVRGRPHGGAGRGRNAETGPAAAARCVARRGAGLWPGRSHGRNLARGPAPAAADVLLPTRRPLRRSVAAPFRRRRAAASSPGADARRAVGAGRADCQGCGADARVADRQTRRPAGAGPGRPGADDRREQALYGGDGDR